MELRKGTITNIDRHTNTGIIEDENEQEIDFLLPLYEDIKIGQAVIFKIELTGTGLLATDINFPSRKKNFQSILCL